MKPRSLLFIAPVLSLLSLSCSDRGTVDPGTGAPPGETGYVALALAAPPPEVVRVAATITRPGFPPRTVELAISDTAQSASGGFTGVPVGVWLLRVEAFGTGGIVLYAGETQVDVRPGQVAQVVLHLQPASGGIRILVTWGPMPPDAGLMAYYPFNGSAVDASGNGNNGTVLGAVPTSDRHGVPGSAYWFDGTEGGIAIPSSPSLHPLNQLTIAFWIRVDSVMDNYMPILHKGGDVVGYMENREYALYLKANSDHPYFQVYSAGDGQGQNYLGSSGHTIHQWLFFVTVIDRQAHEMRVYINGLLDNSTPDPYSSFNINGDPLTIGMESETIWPDHTPFRGAIDEVRLYNRALSPAEIRALYDR